MGEWVNGKKAWCFKWRRALSFREQVIWEEMCRTIEHVSLVEGNEDSWKWKTETGGCYSVKSAYKLLQGPSLGNADPIFHLIWNSKEPSNICAFIWKTVLHRLPTLDNLLHRGIITSVHEACCPLCSQCLESANHLLLECSISATTWSKMYRWLGIFTELPNNCRAHVSQHNFSGFSANQNGVLRMVWYAVAWALWINRNQTIFRGGNLTAEAILEGALLGAWHWMSARVNGFYFLVYEWLLQPLLCIRAID